jgi:hypothetical protein
MAHTEIDIADNGSGIGPESRALIFEKFARLNDPTRAGGAGLGLAICKEIMEFLGGDITYLPGRGGACFRVSLPRRPPVLPENAPEANALNLLATTPCHLARRKLIRSGYEKRSRGTESRGEKAAAGMPPRCTGAMAWFCIESSPNAAMRKSRPCPSPGGGPPAQEFSIERAAAPRLAVPPKNSFGCRSLSNPPNCCR